MTIEQTRQLGIEFERRIQAIMPSEELFNKLDTDTIYAYLNEYQMQYVHDIYRNLDKLEPGTTLTSHVESVLQSMMTSTTLKAENVINDEQNPNTSVWNDIINDCGRSMTWSLPNDYYMYIRSVSNVSSTYSWFTGTSDKTDVLPNIYTKQTDIWKVLETPHNSLRILRYPVVVLSQYSLEDTTSKPTITVIYDRYTTVDGIKVIYYKQPRYFDIMTSTACELPMDAFNDLVNGAVQLYLSYTGGQIKQQKEADRKAQEQAEKENRRSNSNED